MSLRLQHWAPRGGTSAMERIYVHGLCAKAYLYRAAGGIVRFQMEDVTPADLARSREILSSYLIAVGVSEADARAFAWPALMAVCQAAARVAPVTPIRAAPMRGRQQPSLNDRLTNHRMSVESIPIEVPLEIRVDHREPDEIVQLLRRAQNTTVIVESLEVGDYILTSNDRSVVVERKVTRDFQISVENSRLFDEVQRITFLPPTVYGMVILEGDVFSDAITMLPQAVTGAITCLSYVQGVTVLQTLDHLHTAYTLCKAGHHLFGLGYDLPLRKEKPAQLLESKAFVLQGLPGISATLAKSLLDHFGSVRAVMSASRSELLSVHGIGPKKVDQILAVLA